MKTVHEQLAGLKETRVSKSAELQEVVQKSIDEGRTMDTGERERYDTIMSEVKTLDDDISRLSVLAGMQDADKETAKSVIENKSQLPATPGAHVAVPAVAKNTQKLEPGVAFARMARVKALAYTRQLDTTDVLAIAKAVYPGDAKLIEGLKIKAAVDAANTLTPTWAGNLINEGGIAFADFVEYLRPRTLMGQISDRLRRLPFDTPVLVQGSGGSAKWVKEGFAKPLTEWTYTRAKLTPLKVAAIAAVTKETLMRGSMAADVLIRDELARAVGAAIDTKFISSDAAVADESPAGIRNGIAALTLTGDGSAEGVRCDVAAFMQSFADANLSLNGAFWVMPERVAIALSLMQTPLGTSSFPGIGFSGGTFMGLPAFITSYAPTDSNGSVVALIKGDDIFLGDEGGIQVAMSDQATLQMDNTPTQNSAGTPVATAGVSMFQTNSVAILVERFLNFQRRRTQAVVWGTVNWDACA